MQKGYRFDPNEIEQLAMEFAKTLTEARMQRAMMGSGDLTALPDNITRWTAFFYDSYDTFLEGLTSGNRDRTPR